MAIEGRPGSPRRASHSGSHVWPGAVSALGGWLREQSRRPGAVGVAAGVAVAVVNRSARVVAEISAEVMRATSDQSADIARAKPVRRRTPGPRTGTRTTPMRRRKPED
ncbi:MAG: hypothetical protein ACLQNU_02865 [Candidatus Dormibacteria bacterium]